MLFALQCKMLAFFAAMFAYSLPSRVFFVFCRRLDRPINRYRTYKHKIRTLPSFHDKSSTSLISLYRFIGRLKSQ